jgi:hypothetical protein
MKTGAGVWPCINKDFSTFFHSPLFLSSSWFFRSSTSPLLPLLPHLWLGKWTTAARSPSTVTNRLSDHSILHSSIPAWLSSPPSTTNPPRPLVWTLATSVRLYRPRLQRLRTLRKYRQSLQPSHRLIKPSPCPPQQTLASINDSWKLPTSTYPVPSIKTVVWMALYRATPVLRNRILEPLLWHLARIVALPPLLYGVDLLKVEPSVMHVGFTLRLAIPPALLDSNATQHPPTRQPPSLLFPGVPYLLHLHQS